MRGPSVRRNARLSGIAKATAAAIVQLALFGAPSAQAAKPEPANATAITTTTTTTNAAPTPTTHHLVSPNGRVEIAVTIGPSLSYDVRFDGKVLMRGATMSLDVDHVRLGRDVKVTDTRWQHVDRKIEPPVRQKAAVLAELYNELRLGCDGGYTIAFRAYDQGVAYRFETALPARQVKVYGEEANFNFAADAAVYYPQEDSFFSHNERVFQRLRLGQIAPAALASLPAIVETAEGPKVAIAESDIDDYPGLWLRGTGGPGLAATFPPVPLKEKVVRDRDVKVEKAADYIAVTRGTRTFPWRVLGIAEKDTDLVASSLVYLLARPSEIKDTSWIHPGKVAWDWWNALGLRDVDFKPGVNTQTYKYFIDFASRYGIEYIILDEGWYRPGNLLQVVPQIDMREILSYARQKNVGVILWVVWKTFDNQFAPALAQFEKWGVKGLKIDFMQRDDQPVMNFYHRVCRELAKRKMLVDFHGGLRAVLLVRTWPNLLSTEGVQGMEHLKWSNVTDPEHNVTLPFTRMVLGPMDYTPGAMINAAKSSFKIVFNQPMSLGTRCHQLAMYVVYESPLQMLADSPTNYLHEPDAMEFLGPVPTVWDETRILDGRIGDYVVVARRNGRDWYVGAMTDWTPRPIQIDLSFLGAGKFQMTSYEDGPTADRTASDYRKTSAAVTSATRLTVKLAPGGGWAARIRP
jgi:alpha-glucosidase